MNEIIELMNDGEKESDNGNTTIEKSERKGRKKEKGR